MAREGLTPKQEKFARAYIETGNASEAYRRAYDASRMQANAIHVNASKLLSHAKVALWLEQHYQKVAARFEVKLEKLTEMSFETYEQAKDLNDPASAIRCVAQLSKMHGYDAKERENDRMPLGEALQILLGRRKEAAEDTVH